MSNASASMIVNHQFIEFLIRHFHDDPPREWTGVGVIDAIRKAGEQFDATPKPWKTAEPSPAPWWMEPGPCPWIVSQVLAFATMAEVAAHLPNKDLGEQMSKGASTGMMRMIDDCGNGPRPPGWKGPWPPRPHFGSFRDLAVYSKTFPVGIKRTFFENAAKRFAELEIASI